MEEPKKNQRPEEETAVLHLNKFAPGRSEIARGAKPGMDDSATMFIKKAAAEAADQSVQPVVVSSQGNAIPAKEMLGAVAYCYAKGVYTSEDIERKMMKDSELRAATGGAIPDANSIRRFRKLNREAIQSTLEKWYRRLRKQMPPMEALPGARPPEPAPVVPGSLTDPTEPTTMYAKREAAERLNKAAFIDNMSKDG